jgi:uncharacterized protein (TIGR03435 family)
VHELEHVRRADCVINTLALVVSGFYWFHPLVWIASRRLALEAECACDDAVVRGHEATVYAEQLVSIAARLTDKPPSPLLAMANRSDLVQRVSAVLDRQQARGRVGRMAWTAAGLIAVVFSIAMGSLQAARGVAQAPNAQTTGGERPVFEVASIKRGDPIVRRFFLGTVPGRFMATNMTIREVIAFAYDVRKEQIDGGEPWLYSDRFSIEAKPPEGVSIEGAEGLRRLQRMLQSMLEDRFKLTVHRDTVIEPIYELVVAAGGFKLKPVEPRSTGPRGIGSNGQGTANGMAAQMPVLAEFLSGVLGRSVVDKTGVSGQYDFTLTYAPEPGEARAPVPPPETAPPDPNRPSLFAALQEQLGLRLATTRGPVEIIIIDRVEKPTEN